jgi:hypothetical protein
MPEPLPYKQLEIVSMEEPHSIARFTRSCLSNDRIVIWIGNEHVVCSAGTLKVAAEILLNPAPSKAQGKGPAC